MRNERIFAISLFITMTLLLMITAGCKKNSDSPLPSPGTVTDIDGNVYHTIKIGSQVWFAENLKTTRFRDGTSIQNLTTDEAWTGSVINSSGAYCNYNNDAGNAGIYGRLYNWYAISDSRNITPLGWHVPTQDEWETLIAYLGGGTLAGGKLKESGTNSWLMPNTDATNQTGFTALPGGFRVNSGEFGMIGAFCTFWSSTTTDENTAMNCGLFSEAAEATLGLNHKGTGAAIRCIRD